MRRARGCRIILAACVTIPLLSVATFFVANRDDAYRPVYDEVEEGCRAFYMKHRIWPQEIEQVLPLVSGPERSEILRFKKGIRYKFDVLDKVHMKVTYRSSWMGLPFTRTDVIDLDGPGGLADLRP